MVVPRLIHPVPIELRLINRSTTRYDAEAREPVQQAARGAVIIVRGQVSYAGAESGRKFLRTLSGPSESSKGYVLFRHKDLTAAGVTLQDNDRIVKVGGRDVDYYVVKVQETAHYTDQGGSTLVKAHFSDRQPAKQGVA